MVVKLANAPVMLKKKRGANPPVRAPLPSVQYIGATGETGLAHFWSRSRQSLWKKGETSGNMLEVRDIRIDCDQDAVWVKAVPAGPTCHTGARSCFFRRVGAEGLTAVDTME